MTDDLVNHPKHYNKGKFEHVEVVENWELGYHLGNATKYLMRASHKGNRLQDLQKARWYLSRAIDRPWCAIVSYDLLLHPSVGFEIIDVAADWFGEENNAYKAFISIASAALTSPTIGEVIANLQLARDWLDREIKACL